MKTTKRFEEAITKLYKAFHEGTLDAMDCKHCAVGNLVGHENWECGTYPKPLVFDEGFKNNSDYTELELSTIERLFITGSLNFERRLFSNSISNNAVELGLRTKEEKKELQFKGLFAVIKYLAELDNIPDPTDYSKLFETENNEAKYELIF